MSTMSRLVEMPDGQNVQAVFIREENELTTHLLNFWSSARLNPMVAFETEWDHYLEPLTSTRKQKPINNSKILLLKLCNLDNICLIIQLRAFSLTPSALIRFFAVKEIKFVGVNISRDLEMLREDFGIEIKNAIELSQLAADRWNEFRYYASFDRQYEEWDDYRLVIPQTLDCQQKISPTMFGIAFLSAAIAGMKIPSTPPNYLLTNGPDEVAVLAYDYHTIPVYAALRVGIKLLECKIKH